VDYRRERREGHTDQREDFFTFVSATKAYRSASLNAHPELGTLWSDKIEADVTIDGNTFTTTFQMEKVN
jgi:hypothetical protein